MYVRPVLEALGLAEVEHNPKNNRLRAAGAKKERAGRGSGGGSGQKRSAIQAAMLATATGWLAGCSKLLCPVKCSSR